MIEKVKEFGSKLYAHPLTMGEIGILKESKIEITNSGHSKNGINTRLITKSKGGRLSKASSIKPHAQSLFGAARKFRLASGDHVWSRSTPERVRQIDGGS